MRRNQGDPGRDDSYTEGMSANSGRPVCRCLCESGSEKAQYEIKEKMT